MTVEVNPGRGRDVGRILFKNWNSEGFFGTRSMPEDILPEGLKPGSPEHALFLTLTVALDYMRDSDKLWEASRKVFANPDTRYLFDPNQVVQIDSSQVRADLIKHGVALRPNQDPDVWITISSTLHRSFGGRVEPLLLKGAWSGPHILKLIRGAVYRNGFPNLKGDLIAGIWLRILKDTWRGHEILNLERVDLPVNEHIAAATVMTGCITGAQKGSYKRLAEIVQKLWREASAGTEFYALQLDRPLWTLSRNGCRKTSTMPCEFKGACPVAEYCTGTRLTVFGAKDTTPDSARFETGVW